MWESDLRLELISSGIAQAIDKFCLKNDTRVFDQVYLDLRQEFPTLSEQEILRFIGICVNTAGRVNAERTELAITAPASFDVKARKLHDVSEMMLQKAVESILICGYPAIDYYPEMIDLIALKLRQGVIIRMFLDDHDDAEAHFQKLTTIKNNHPDIWLRQKNADAAISEFHVKAIVIDGRELLLSSADMSYRGMLGNIEMGIRMESRDKARQIENLLKQMSDMKVFGKMGEDK